MDAAVRFVNVTKRFGSQLVLDELCLDIPRGRITYILGRSGVGKSVLIKHIIGLLKPDTGEIWVDGQDVTKLSETRLNELRMKFGMLFQDAALFDSMTAYENIAFPLQEHRSLSVKEEQAVVAGKLAQVGLSGVEEKFPSQLSGGMRKRVGLARAIALDPEIILYDEPTTGLDPLMVQQVDELIVKTQEQQRSTSIVISHDIPTALRSADLIAVLDAGKIVALGEPEEIRKSEHPFVKEFLQAGN